MRGIVSMRYGKYVCPGHNHVFISLGPPPAAPDDVVVRLEKGKGSLVLLRILSSPISKLEIVSLLRV